MTVYLHSRMEFSVPVLERESCFWSDGLPVVLEKTQKWGRQTSAHYHVNSVHTKPVHPYVPPCFASGLTTRVRLCTCRAGCSVHVCLPAGLAGVYCTYWLLSRHIRAVLLATSCTVRPHIPPLTRGLPVHVCNSDRQVGFRFWNDLYLHAIHTIPVLDPIFREQGQFWMAWTWWAV